VEIEAHIYVKVVKGIRKKPKNGQIAVSYARENQFVQRKITNITIRGENNNAAMMAQPMTSSYAALSAGTAATV
jgi:hypothetical protein